MEINGENSNFITLKDHKEKFNNIPTVGLINPAKNELGLISKVILDATNKHIREAIALNHWRNIDTVIDWFKGIQNKHLYKTFIIFDTSEFYPSINENLIKKALTFVEAHTLLSDDVKPIIYHARKSLLFKGTVTDIRYFAWSKFSRSLVHKKHFKLDMTSSFQVNIRILSREVGYLF